MREGVRRHGYITTMNVMHAPERRERRCRNTGGKQGRSNNTVHTRHDNTKQSTHAHEITRKITTHSVPRDTRRARTGGDREGVGLVGDLRPTTMHISHFMSKTDLVATKISSTLSI